MRLAKAVTLLILGVMLIAGVACDGGGGAEPTPTPTATAEPTAEPTAMGTPIGTPTGDVVTVTKADHESEVTIGVGGWLVAQLETWPVRGWGWTVERNSDPGVMKQIGMTFVSWDTPTPSPPDYVAGDEIWTFEGLKPGTTELIMHYINIQPGIVFYGGFFNLSVTVQ